ncbi:uncharacterized protein LOC144106595 [Amblyomma americanum]
MEQVPKIGAEMAVVSGDPETETEQTEPASAQQCGASFEPRNGGDYAEPAERQGQRRAGAPNALSLVLAERSIEEANCTSLPFRLGATFFASSSEGATKRRAEPAFLTDNATANFPSAGVAVNAEQKTATSDTSAGVTELSSGDSRYHTAEGKLVLHYENADTSFTADLLTEAASRRGLLSHERVFEVVNGHGLRLNQLDNELLPVQPSEGEERETDAKILLSTQNSGLGDHLPGPRQEVNEPKENQCFETVEVEMEMDVYSGTQEGGLQCLAFPLVLRDHLSGSMNGVNVPEQNYCVETETVETEMEMDDHAGTQEGDLQCLAFPLVLRDHLSGSRHGVNDPEQNYCFETETVGTEMEMDELAGTQERVLNCSLLPARHAFTELQPLEDAEANVRVVTDTPVLSQDSGPTIMPEVSYPGERGYLQVCREVELKSEPTNESFKRPYDSGDVVAVVKRTRTMVVDEVLIIDGVPTGAFMNREGTVSFYYSLMHDACTDAAFAGQRGTEEELPKVDISGDLARGMIVSVSDGVVSSGWTRSANEDETIPLCYTKRQNADQIDWSRQTRAIESAPMNNAAECRELSPCQTAVFPGPLSDHGYCKKVVAWNIPGNSRDSGPPASVIPLLLEEQYRPWNLSECFSQESPDDESAVTTSRPTEEPPTYPELQPEDSESYTFEGQSWTQGKHSRAVSSEEVGCARVVQIGYKAVAESLSSAVNENTCMPSSQSSTERTESSNLEVQVGSADAEPRNMTKKCATIHSIPQLSFSGTGSNFPSRQQCVASTVPSGACNDPSLVLSSPWLQTYAGFPPLHEEQHEAYYGQVSSCGGLPNAGQEIRDTCPKDETPVRSEAMEMDDSSRSPTFRTQCSDDNFEVLCIQSPDSQVEDQDASFYDENTAPGSSHVFRQDNFPYLKASQTVSRDDDDKENYNDASLSSSRSEAVHRRIKLRTLKYASAAALAPIGMVQRGRLLCNGYPSSSTSYDSECGDDYSEDKSCTLCSTSEEEYSDVSDLDLFDDTDTPSSSYSDSDGPESGDSVSAADLPLRTVAKSPVEEGEHAKERELDDDTELFSSASSASTIPRKRKWGLVSSEPSESPVAVKIMRRYPVPGPEDEIVVEHGDTERPNQRTKCALNELGFAHSSESGVCGWQSADTYSCSGVSQERWKPVDNYRNNNPCAAAPFNRDTTPNKLTSGDSKEHDVTESFAGGPGRDKRNPDSVTYGKPTDPGALDMELVSLVDYEELTSEEHCDSSPPYQQPCLEPEICLVEDGEPSALPPEGEQVVKGTYKKLMEVFFDEDSKRFMVVPTSDECLVKDEAINANTPGGTAEKEEASASSDAAMPVELCTIRALNDQVVPDISASGGVNSSEDPMYPENAHCGAPRKIRRIGLPKRYKGPGLHSKWKADCDN